MTGRLSPASLATLLMLVAAGTSALQNLVIRLAGDSGVHSFQIAFLRSFFGFVVIAAIVLTVARRVPGTGAMRQIGASSLFHFASMLTGFHGITLMPLAESSARPSRGRSSARSLPRCSWARRSACGDGSRSSPVSRAC